MLKLVSHLAPLFGAHDAAHCHCHKHYLPSPQTRRNRLLVQLLAGALGATATGWLLYHLIVWACSLPGSMRIG